MRRLFCLFVCFACLFVCFCFLFLFLFIYLCFAFHFSKPLKYVFCLPRWKFSTGKKHSTPGKKSRNRTLPPLKNILLSPLEDATVYYFLKFLYSPLEDGPCITFSNSHVEVGIREICNTSFSKHLAFLGM